MIPAALKHQFACLAVVLMWACTTTPAPITSPQPPDETQVTDAVGLDPASISSLEELPGWQTASIGPALEAFRKSCNRWSTRAADAQISTRAPYAGRVSDWSPVCASLEGVSDPAAARLVLSTLLVPVAIDPGEQRARFTGYFEPQIDARRAPVWPYVQPVPGLPSDLVQVDGSEIGLTEGERVPAQRLPDGSLRPYPERKDIVIETSRVLGYAHPADVFFLQIQGSGRLRFSDGETVRAAYAAHNGQPFRSTANWLLRTDRIERGEASMQGIRAWMDRAGFEEAQLAMNQNPRFVFFSEQPIEDAGLGPKGAFNVPLTPFGSVAVDTSLHPLGVPMFIETSAPGLGGLWQGLMIAQDTGGAIKGPVRGDLYFGTGAAAGDRAGTMNAPGRMWVVLPKSVAAQLKSGSS